MLVFHFTPCTRCIEKQQFWNKTLGDTSLRHFIWNPVWRILINSHNLYKHIFPSFFGRTTTVVLWFALWPHREEVAGSIPSPGWGHSAWSLHVLSLSLCGFSRSWGFLSPSKNLHIRLTRSSKLCGGISATGCLSLCVALRYPLTQDATLLLS